MSIEAYLAKAEEYSKRSKAKNTERMHESRTRTYETWCRAEGIDPYPLTEDKIAAHLVARASEVSVASVRAARSTLIRDHPALRDSPKLAQLMRGIARAHGTMVGQAKGLSHQDYLAIRALDKPWPKSSLGILWRDIALVGTMRDLMLRRSEAVALRWEDVEYQKDGGALVTIRFSKTDQEGLGAIRYMDKMATGDLRRWQREQPGHSQYLDMRRVFGLSRGRTVCEIIQRLAAQAGLEGAYSGHSPRIGMTEDLVAMPGVSMPALQFAGRWTSPQMPLHYARAMDARRGPIAQFYDSVGSGPPAQGAPEHRPFFE